MQRSLSFDLQGPQRCLVFALSVCTWLLAGCASKMPEVTQPLTEYDPKSLQLVEDLARPWGLKSDRVDGVSLVVGLPGTGSDPPPSAERESLFREMQTRDVDKPNQVLASNATSLVLVRGYIPPGARKGEHFDIDVSIPKNSETTSLRSGWLMLARLREYARVEGRVASGNVLAHAQGDVLVDALAEGADDPVTLTRGRILGGGVVLVDRRLGMAIRDGHNSVKTSARIGEAINRRFHVYHDGRRQGVAKPQSDDFVELLVHPAYRDNLVRYMRVVQNIPVRETPMQRAARLRSLRDRLFDPRSASMAAVQLEAIGTESIPILEEASTSCDSEIRFYAAEALAYLNEPSASSVLARLARQEPAFRWRALTAMGAIEDLTVQEELIHLLDAPSAETRYGAFQALQKITPDDPVIEARVVGERFHLHCLTSSATPLVHISQKDRPEIVLFGSDHPVITPCVVFAGSDIVIRGDDTGTLAISRLTAGEKDDRVRTAANLEAMLEGIVEVGGSYADVVHAISATKQAGCLESRIAFSAIPEVGRTYRREENADEEPRADLAAATIRDSVPPSKLPTETSDLDAISDRLLAPHNETISASTEDNGSVQDYGPEFLFDDEIVDSH